MYNIHQHVYVFTHTHTHTHTHMPTHTPTHTHIQDTATQDAATFNMSLAEDAPSEPPAHRPAVTRHGSPWATRMSPPSAPAPRHRAGDTGMPHMSTSSSLETDAADDLDLSREIRRALQRPSYASVGGTGAAGAADSAARGAASPSAQGEAAARGLLGLGARGGYQSRDESIMSGTLTDSSSFEVMV